MSKSPKHKERDPRDFYRTPAWVVDALLDQRVMKFAATLDPCAGDGNIVAAARAAGHECDGIELDLELVEAGKALGRPIWQGDGLSIDPANEVLLINPPFTDIIPWLDLASRAQEGAVLIRMDALSSGKRFEWWSQNQPSGLVILSNRPSFTEDGQTDQSDYCWVLYGCEPFGLRWVNVDKDVRRPGPTRRRRRKDDEVQADQRTGDGDGPSP